MKKRQASNNTPCIMQHTKPDIIFELPMQVKFISFVT